MTEENLSMEQVREMHAMMNRVHDEYDARLLDKSIGKSAILTYQCRKRGCALLHVFRLPWHDKLIMGRPPTRSSPDHSWWIPSREVMDEVHETRDYIGALQKHGMRTGYPVRERSSTVWEWEGPSLSANPRIQCHHLPRAKMPAAQIARDLADRSRRTNRVKLP